MASTPSDGDRAPGAGALLGAVPARGGTMEAVPVLEAAMGLCAGLEMNEVHALSTTERRRVLAAMDRLAAALAVAKARVLAVEEASGDWALGGAKNVASWRAESTRAGFGAAKGELELASALGELPRLGDAVTTGGMTVEHAKAVARELHDASPAQKQVLLGDQGLQERIFHAAGRSDAGRFRRSIKRTMAEIDPAKFQRDHDAVHERRYVRMWNERGGVRFEALLNPFDGRKVAEALNAGAPRPAADDPRSSEQRGADALVALADAILGYGDGGSGVLPGANRPHVTVMVSAAQMAGWETRGEFPGAVLDDDTIIPPAQFGALLCDASLMRVVLDADARPAGFGENVRTFGGAHRRVLIARDRGCAWPGCGLAVRYTEGHHVRWWSDGGKTTTDNGILLCTRHHHAIHEGRMRIVPIAGGFRFDRPDGTVYGTHLFRPLPNAPGLGRSSPAAPLAASG